MSEIKQTYIDEVLSEHPEWIPDWKDDCRTNDFVDTRRFSPVVYDSSQAMPERDDPNYNDWWYEQFSRCIKGYVVHNATRRGHSIWIPGRYYFYLNFWMILAKLDGVNRKGLRHPRFISLDYFKFMAIEVMYLENSDQIFGKSRQKGFSEFIACILAYNFSFIPHTVNVVVAGSSGYAEHTMENTIRGLDYLSNTEFFKRRRPDRADYVKAMYTEKEEILDENGVGTGEFMTVVRGLGSELYCITAKDNTQAVSRLSPSLIVYEEVGKWKQGALIETMGFVKPSIVAEHVKTGWQVLIGTGGDMDESVADVQKIMYDPKKYNMRAYRNTFEENLEVTTGKVGCFIAGFLFEIIDDDGNSLIDESIKAILSERVDSTDCTQKPIYLSEMFMMNSGGYFGKEIVSHINTQKRLILNHKELQVVQQGELDWIDHRDWTKGVTWRPTDKGIYFITEHPEKAPSGGEFVNLYNGAIDSYDKDESETSYSKGSITIWKDVYDFKHTYRMWVARMSQRPSEEEGGSPKFYENTIKLLIYYGSCQALIEYSNVLIFDYYKRWGFDYLLKERPSLVISQHVMDPKAQQRYGVEQSFIPHALRMLKEELKADNFAVIYKTYDLTILERLAAFKVAKGYNCDVTITCALNIVSSTEDRELEVYDEGAIEEVHSFGGYTMKNGIITRR